MRTAAMIVGVLFIAISSSAADKNPQGHVSVYTDQDLEQYKYPSDLRTPDVDLGHEEDKTVSAESKTSAQETAHSEKSLSSGEDKKRAYSEISVILYKTSTWPYAKKARAYLQSLGVNLTEYDIAKDSSKRSEMVTKSGSTGVPFMDVEGIYVHGFSAQKIKQAVEERRSVEH